MLYRLKYCKTRYIHPFGPYHHIHSDSSQHSHTRYFYHIYTNIPISWNSSIHCYKGYLPASPITTRISGSYIPTKQFHSNSIYLLISYICLLFYFYFFSSSRFSPSLRKSWRNVWSKCALIVRYIERENCRVWKRVVEITDSNSLLKKLPTADHTRRHPERSRAPSKKDTSQPPWTAYSNTLSLSQ